jgi:ABC-type multidrug transport system ATPase subunit/peptidoglycan/LPS O-acetylase OafA/YrhL
MSTPDRLHSLDAVRAFALLLGVAFHAGFSFLPGLPPGIWAFNDSSPSTPIAVFLFVSHIFRMSLFFFVAGFFGRMLYQRGGARGFWTNRLKRILLPLIVGWVVLFPALAGVWMWGLTKTFGGTLPQAPANLPPPPPLAFPLTHLWFLYYLLVLYAALLLGRRMLVSIDRSGWLRRTVDSAVGLAVRSTAAAVVLALPLTLALYVRETWFAWFGVPTPDQSLLPEAASFVGFGTAIAFGWLTHRQRDLLDVWGRQWPLHAAGAVIATVASLWMAGLAPQLVPAPSGLPKLALAFSYSIAIWCWCFAVVGLAMRALSTENATVRYVADASYWIYLVHLPVVAALQVAVGDLPLHWSIKFPLILIASFTLLFATYRYLVRSTFIGQFLNGHRYRRTGATPGPGTHPSGQPPQPSKGLAERSSGGGQATVLAALAGVHKRYGSTVALAGLDLQVRRGELLAVLGPNGAGKSTAISLWLGLLEPDEGTARLFDRSPLDVEGRRHVGVMMQEVALTPELRVRELVALTASYYPDPLPADHVLELTHTQTIAHRPYAKLSAGQKRQVQFALAICGRPALLFLDEPTVGLDVGARETMWRIIRAMIAEGCSIVLTTHYLEEAEALADRVAVLASGRLLASGSVDEIRSLVSRKQISCSTTLAAEDVRTWPDVVAVEAGAQRLRITVVDAEPVLRRLLASDDCLRDVEVRRAGLSEAFVELTREAA